MKAKTVNSRRIVILGFMVCALSALPATLPSCSESGVDINIGDYNLRTLMSGSGQPTVIFISGLSDKLSVWNKVQPTVAGYATTISYDRGGVGDSDDGPDPRTGLAVVEELHQLLAVLNPPKPYVLVAHSLGGMFARLYANQYPADIAGMVLIEARHEDQDKVEALNLQPKTAADSQLFGELDAEIIGGDGPTGEFVNQQNTYEELKDNENIPPIPLAVLRAEITSTTGDNPKLNDIKIMFQDEMALLSPNSQKINVANSGHVVQTDQPQAVIDAIDWVLTQAGFTVPE
jgi:pimeloyl-ACP methyl ester carboxylesterase